MTNAPDSANLTAALAYAARGWHVVPGIPGERRPALPDWPERATTDPDLIRAWWEGGTDYVVGLATGKSGLIVVDVDVHEDGENGFESMGRLANALGQPLDLLDGISLVSRSGGGGQHHLFLAPDGVDFSKRKIGWMPGVDVLVGASFLVLPPSPHPSGQAYAWLRGPDDFAVEPLPDELLRHLLGTASDGVREDTAGRDLADLLARGSRDGQRNNDLIRLIGYLRRSLGDTPEARDEIRRRLEAWRDLCVPPYRGQREDAEFDRTWESGLALDHEDRNPRWPLPGADPRGEHGLGLLTPLGLADWLEPRIGARIRYRNESQEMLVWTGRRWDANDRNDEPLWPTLRDWGVLDRLEETIEDMAGQADERAGARLRAWLEKALDRKYFSEASLTVATRPERIVQRDHLDAHADLLHCQNGVVDLRTGTLTDHDPALMNTSLVPIEYDPGARSPLLAAQLESMFPGDPGMQAYLQRAIGVSLFGDNRAKALFVLRGEANTGKSTLLQALLPILGAGSGHGYADVADKKLFVQPKGDQHPAGLADALKYRVILMSEEYGERDRLNMPLLKAVTGNDRLTARFMRQDFWSGVARCTPWMATNHDLRVGEFDEAVRTRLRIIDVPGVIPPERRRDGVTGELLRESAGILAWAVRGAVEYMRAGLQEPESVRRAVEALVDEQDHVLAFVQDRLQPWAEGWEPQQLREHGVSILELYAVYETWTRGQGAQPLYQTEFGRRLKRALGGHFDPPRVRVHGQMTRLYPCSWLDPTV
jgi:P4 family phage/plasmid primase-like protien